MRGLTIICFIPMLISLYPSKLENANRPSFLSYLTKLTSSLFRIRETNKIKKWISSLSTLNLYDEIASLFYLNSFYVLVMGVRRNMMYRDFSEVCVPCSQFDCFLA